MREEHDWRDRRIGRWFAIGRGMAVMVMTMLLFCTSATPVNANVFSTLGQLYGCIVTWGLVCDLSETVIGTGQPTPPIPVTCEQPLLNGLPQFLSWPEGQAKYRFQSTCSSPAKPGAMMTVRWEGTWNPAETKTDRPNAVESLTITGYEAFLPDRAPGPMVFMYFTAQCGKDPWLRVLPRRGGSPNRIGSIQGSMRMNVPIFVEADGCNPFGAYIPDDLREAFPHIDKQRFPRTGTIISRSDKQRLSAEYQRANPSYFSRMGIQPRPSSKALQQATIPQSSGIVEKPSANLKLFSRGTDVPEQAQPEGQGPQEQTAIDTPSSVASLSEGMDDSPAFPQVAITFDQPLHFMSAKGEDTLIEPGIYEIEPVLDLQLSLAREGQSAVLLPAIQGTHSEAIQQSLALLVQGESNDEQHLILLTPDGKRFDAVGSISGVKSHGTGMTVALPHRRLKDAIVQPTAQPAPPPCKDNPYPIGPRYLPIPCTLWSGQTYKGDPPPGAGFPIPPPAIPYLDGTNMLYACLNNKTGEFRVVHPPDACFTAGGEVKVKWQLAP